MPLVVVGAPLGLAGPHRQQRLGAVQRLDLALLVDAQHHRAIRRIEIEPDDVAHLLHEQRIGRELEGLDAMRLQPEGLPDAMDGRGRMADRRRHGAQAPVRGARRPRLQRPPDGVGDRVVADPARRARPRLVVEAVQALRGKPLAPLADRAPANAQPLGDQPVVTTSAAASTIRARCASPCPVDRRRASDSSSRRSSTDKHNLAALPFAILTSSSGKPECSEFLDQDTSTWRTILSSPKGARARALTQAAGARLLFLPPYSPRPKSHRECLR